MSNETKVIMSYTEFTDMKSAEDKYNRLIAYIRKCFRYVHNLGAECSHCTTRLCRTCPHRNDILYVNANKLIQLTKAYALSGLPVDVDIEEVPIEITDNIEGD